MSSVKIDDMLMSSRGSVRVISPPRRVWDAMIRTRTGCTGVAPQ
jgi:hypothetical protein